MKCSCWQRVQSSLRRAAGGGGCISGCWRWWLCLRRGDGCQGAQGHQGLHWQVTSSHRARWSWDLSGTRCCRTLIAEGGICLQRWGSLRTSSQFLPCSWNPDWEIPAPRQCEGSLVSKSKSMTLILYPLQRRSPLASYRSL